MTFLWGLWWISIVLAAAALILMFGLIMARQRHDRAVQERAAHRALIHKVFFDIMAGDGDAAGRLNHVGRRTRVLAEAFLEVLALVRGDERERLVGSLRAIGVDERLRTRTTLGSWAGRIVAAEALAAFPSARTRHALKYALTVQDNVHFRVAAFRSLLDMDEWLRLEDIFVDLERSRGADSLLYLPIVQRLAAKDVDAAINALLDPRREALRPLLVEAIGMAGDFRALPVLAELVRAPDFEIRTAAVRALGDLGHPAGGPAIAAALSDSAWEVRGAACQAAARTGLAPLIPQISERLADPTWWVRFRAGEALIALGAPGVAALRSAASDGPGNVARTASLVLAEKGVLSPQRTAAR